jgi:predicted Zn-dependent protease
LAKAAGGGDADYLLGLIAWERGKKADFGQADEKANYFRAMQAIQSGNTDQAIKLLQALVAKRPKVYRPRLMLAYLKRDARQGAALADENPASPEAQLVLELLGTEGAAEAKKQLLQNNPGAARQVEIFRGSLTKGTWQHLPRWAPKMPK